MYDIKVKLQYSDKAHETVKQRIAQTFLTTESHGRPRKSQKNDKSSKIYYCFETITIC